ncbi:Gfo/Idh/MocA family protein [Priestia endophytica]|uniref:Predicted dehydrogenase n=1 Tax=Priestia endophytica DSM 13796 TaxID=1121089 RepID=A0A1I6BTL8_9BACI|nr:Gfo/Idh/MocA family oxidoreductase [Priestia endophytica]KYG34209.1 oxidoreductase [Priestia endophytica]SFQ84261.1 Predicted dehydrogenase [Priestia endophytica DSM 13796]
MTKHVRWGILSTAQIAQDELLPAFRDATNAKVVAIASTNDKVKHIASKFDIPKIYGSYDELLEDSGIDAVYIPLPNSLHSQWVKRAAEKGKHILCEKPAVLNTREAEEVIETCKKNNVMFMEAFMYQFHPQHQRVKEILISGEIGEVNIMKVSLSFYLENQNENIRMRQELGGGSLYDVGCYCIHSIRNILNTEPNRIFASQQKDVKGQVDMSVVCFMELDNGMTAVFDAAMDRAQIDYYEIIGTKGSIRVPKAFIPQMYNGEAQIIVNTTDGAYREEKVLGHQYILEVEYFSQCVLNGEISRSMMEDTIENVKVIEACFKSIEKETFIDI